MKSKLKWTLISLLIGVVIWQGISLLFVSRFNYRYSDDFLNQNDPEGYYFKYLKTIYFIWCIYCLPVLAFFLPIFFAIKQYTIKKRNKIGIVLFLMILFSVVNFYLLAFKTPQYNLSSYGIIYEARKNGLDKFDSTVYEFIIGMNTPSTMNYEQLNQYIDTAKISDAITQNKFEKMQKEKSKMISFPIISSILILGGFLIGNSIGKSVNNKKIALKK